MGAVDILVAVVMCLEIEESLGCMYYLIDGGLMGYGRVWRRADEDDAYIFVV